MTATPIAEGAHGGNLDWAMREFGGASETWLDLSTGINPWAYGFDAPPVDAWTRLPGESAAARLQHAAARYYGAESPASVVIGPGSQALIQRLPALRPNARVAVVGELSYSEHAASWRNAGNDVSTGLSLSRAIADAEVIVVTNPNNPDAAVHGAAALREAHRDLLGRGGLLVVDEAFADVVPEASLAADAGADGLVILKSFGKFFGLAGLRLGFALTAPEDRATLEQALGPWPVTGPALEIGCQAVGDQDWQRNTRARLETSMTAFSQAIEAAAGSVTGLRIVGATPLFILVEHPHAPRVWQSAAQAHILLRRFIERPTWLRIGVPPSPQAAERLVNLLTRPLP